LPVSAAALQRNRLRAAGFDALIRPARVNISEATGWTANHAPISSGACSSPVKIFSTRFVICLSRENRQSGASLDSAA
jgi:hypothetical protein